MGNDGLANETVPFGTDAQNTLESSTTPQSPRTETMASTLLRRQLAQAARLPPRPAASSSLLTSRHISSTTPALVQQHTDPSASAQTRGVKNVFDTHTVEDLQGMHAADILAETGTRKDAQMRHFTGEFALYGSRCGPR